MKKSGLIILLAIIALNMHLSTLIVNGEDQNVIFTEIAQISTEGRTDYVKIEEELVYIFDFEKGFLVYDIDSPLIN